MADSKHDRIAKRLANKHGVEYNEGKGPDIRASDRVIEVVTHDSDLYTSIAQVSRSKKPKYFAVPQELVKKAKKVTEGTGIGVITPTGITKKRSRSR